ncbi:acyl carrier protein [Streptomyces albireticuli]|uniref:Polyketide-8 synthase acyl carrier protein n=1 Tax=Streptomyces albireticuli TaxID=1940 RepID=A0A2A2D5H5_9ACTN|nr:acyl carrier protein [Streptomyces albireticuli]MCD9194590.1 acyl carrier protein [Streptomyces albireticuli]PAU47738.1 polyketide-8 synthase acyl carrier protein [Streptomyces albireticuli]
MSVQPQSPVLDVEELRAVVAGALELPVEEVTDDARFKEDLDVDSLISLEIAVRVEERFGIRIDDAELAGLGSFRRVSALVRDRVGGRSAA